MLGRLHDDAQESEHQAGLLVLDGLEAAREDLDKDEVRRQELLGRRKLLVHECLVGRRVLDRVRKGVDCAAGDAQEASAPVTTAAEERISEYSMTHFIEVLKRPLRVSIVHVHCETTSVRRAISAEGRSLTSQPQASAPAATDRGEKARIGIETRW